MWHSNKCTICIDVFFLLPLGNGHYLHLHVYVMSAVKTARLIRIEYPLAEQMCFTFWYYMLTWYEYEPNRGMLNVTWKSSTDSIVLWTNSKTTNGRWSFAAININANDNKTHTLAIEGILNPGNYQYSISVDDVSMTIGSCSGISRNVYIIISLNVLSM